MYFQTSDTATFWIIFCIETSKKTAIFMLYARYDFMNWTKVYSTENWISDFL